MTHKVRRLILCTVITTAFIGTYTAGFKRGYTESIQRYNKAITDLNKDKKCLYSLLSKSNYDICRKDAQVYKLRSYIKDLKSKRRRCKIDKFVVTAYSPYENVSGIENNGDASATSTGVKPTYGTIAVDPRVIPYGSNIVVLYDDGSTYVGRAEDCGGAIKGNRLDVFKRTYKETTEHGRKTATVIWW